MDVNFATCNENMDLPKRNTVRQGTEYITLLAARSSQSLLTSSFESQTAFLADMAESDPRLSRFTYFPFGLLSPGGGNTFRRVLCTQLT